MGKGGRGGGCCLRCARSPSSPLIRSIQCPSREGFACTDALVMRTDAQLRTQRSDAALISRYPPFSLPHLRHLRVAPLPSPLSPLPLSPLSPLSPLLLGPHQAQAEC